MHPIGGYKCGYIDRSKPVSATLSTSLNPWGATNSQRQRPCRSASALEQHLHPELNLAARARCCRNHASGGTLLRCGCVHHLVGRF